MSALDKTKQDKVTALYRLQSQNETSWGQIDAVLKTTDDVKMLQVRVRLEDDSIMYFPCRIYRNTYDQLNSLSILLQEFSSLGPETM